MCLSRPHQFSFQFFLFYLDPPPPVPSLLLPLCKGLGGYLLLVFWWGWMAFTSLFIVYPPIIRIEGPVHIHSIIPFFYRDCVLGLTHWVLRWNSWTAFFAEVSRHQLESFQTQVFVWFSTLIFLSFLVSRFFFCKDFKTQSRVCLSLKSASRRDCEKPGTEGLSLLLKLWPRISSLYRVFQAVKAQASHPHMGLSSSLQVRNIKAISGPV